jgi:hypothetical protein
MVRLVVLLLGVLVLAPACGNPANTAYLPIGSRCRVNDDCGTPKYSCLTGKPGGYCTFDCAVDSECPVDSVCAGGKCHRKCSETAQCRSAEGYVCRDVGATSLVCDVPASS